VFIQTLKIEHLRNIASAELHFTNNINIVYGENGAGKTSLLEAIYLLGRAKSFRTSNRKSPIEKGRERTSLFALIENNKSSTHRVGLTRRGKETKVKIDGQPVNKLSKLANTIPITIVTPQSHRLIEEGPEHRRRILNWGVFHVEPRFKALMGDYTRSLLQRNKALREGSPDLSAWTHKLIHTARQVNEIQSKYFTLWREELLTKSNTFPFLEGLDIYFSKGWPEEADLKEMILSREASDREKGFTTLGPHRADVAFRVGGMEAGQLLSRGQQKVLIVTVLLSQARLLEKDRAVKPIFLCDDLDSELDYKSLARLCELIDEQKCQTFITTLDPNRLTTGVWTEKTSMFHVEHGHFL
jgi:DNA replication and repair protein RecF